MITTWRLRRRARSHRSRPADARLRRGVFESLEGRHLLAANQFAVIGDFGSDNAKELAVANMVKSWNPGFVITVGDNNYPDGAAATIDANIGKYYQEFIGNYQGTYGPGSATNRFYPSLGNHDWHAAGATPYLNYFTLPGNERYYDYVQQGVHFFVVDSDPDEPDGDTSTSTQGRWLQNALAQSADNFNVVYFHHAPYSSSSNHGSNSTLQWPFKAWGADAVLAGHDHTYERLSVDGIPYFVNGLGGHSSLYSFGTPLPQSQVRYNANNGAMRVTINPSSVLFEFFSITGGGSLVDSFTVTTSTTSTVADRRLFYADSVYDNNSLIPGMTGHDVARATDKVALAPGGGQSTFANFSSYNLGINGLMVDLTAGGTHGSITAGDFTFRTSGPFANNDPNGTDGGPVWATVATAATVSVRPGAGAGGTDRVEITWPNNAIKNTWLEVTVKANSRTGLATPDIFYFGNLVGDSGLGNAVDAAFTDATDVIAARSHQASDLWDLSTPATLAAAMQNPYDYNRDNHVDATDIIIARANQAELDAINIANPPHAPASSDQTGTDSALATGWWVALADRLEYAPPLTFSAIEKSDSNIAAVTQVFRDLGGALPARARPAAIKAQRSRDVLPGNTALVIDSILGEWQLADA